MYLPNFQTKHPQIESMMLCVKAEVLVRQSRTEGELKLQQCVRTEFGT